MAFPCLQSKGGRDGQQGQHGTFLWSPYEEAYPLAKVTPDDTPESLARLFDNLCTPTHYNAAQAWQRTMMDEKHYWMDDLRYISRWLRTFFGDLIQPHF